MFCRQHFPEVKYLTFVFTVLDQQIRVIVAYSFQKSHYKATFFMSLKKLEAVVRNET